jgi:hypothetical protein
VPRHTLVVSARCHPHSSVSASTVWLRTTSPPGAPPRPAASSASARRIERGIACTVVRIPWTGCGRLLSAVPAVVFQMANMVILIRVRAIPVLAITLTITTAMSRTPAAHRSHSLGLGGGQCSGMCPLSLWKRFSAQPNRASVPLHLDHADNVSR